VSSWVRAFIATCFRASKAVRRHQQLCIPIVSLPYFYSKRQSDGMPRGLHMGRAENRASGRHNAPRYAFVQPRCDTTVVIHTTIQQHLYPLIYAFLFSTSTSALLRSASASARLASLSRVSASRVPLHAFLEQPRRLFFRPHDIFAPTTHAAAIGRFRREKEPDVMGWRHKPCRRRDEDSGGDAGGPDMHR